MNKAVLLRDRRRRVARAEITSPFHAFDAVYCICHEDQPARREAMRQRFAVEEVRTQALKSILIFEDENQFSPDAGERMTASLAKLEGDDWQTSLLDEPAIAYHRSTYATILTSVPDDALEVAPLVAGFDEQSGISMRPHTRTLSRHIVTDEHGRKTGAAP